MVGEISMAPELRLEVIRCERAVERSKSRGFIEAVHRKGATKQVKCIDRFEERLASECEASECAICFEDFASDTRVIQLPCKHAFHPCCIGQWMVRCQKTCPLC